MFSSLAKLVGRLLGLFLLLATIFVFASSVLADPTDPDGGDQPQPPAPRPCCGELI